MSFILQFRVPGPLSEALEELEFADIVGDKREIQSESLNLTLFRKARIREMRGR